MSSKTEKLKNQVVDSFENKNKLKFYAYEFGGTGLLVFASNMTGGNWDIMYIVALWICWETSCAHFNSAISLATLFFNVKKVGEHMTTFAILTVVQFCGGLFGIFLTDMATYVNNNTYDTHDGKSTYDTQTYHPTAPV